MIKFGLDSSRPLPKVVSNSLEPIVRFFGYHDAHPVALGMVCMEKFGMEWLEWTPEALRDSILTTFKASSVAEHVWQKIQAFRALMLVSSPWSEWEVFENIIQALNNNVPDIHVVQKCSVPQLFAGVDIMNQIRDTEPWGDEIKGYVAACAIDSGVTCLPEPLEWAQETLSEPTYRCDDCGNEDAADLEDGRCDVCSERFCDDRPLNGKANPRLPKECGTNIRVFLKRDPAGVCDRLEELKAGKTVKLNEESAIDVQAVKLMVGHEYMNQRRRELVEQLEELKAWVTH